MSEKRNDLVWFLLILVVLIGIVPLLLRESWTWQGAGMWGMMGYGWGFMFLIPLALLVLIVLGIYYLVTVFTRTGKPEYSDGGKALEILKEQYAKGEITREQYLKMKEDLE